MLRRVPRFVISAGALAAVLGTVVSVRGQHPHPLQTVKAGLVKPLNANDAQAGTPFYLKTSDVWQTGNCTVRANTMLAGQVESIKSRSDGSKREELALRFAPVSCEGNEIVQVIPVLIAMRGPEPPNDDRELKNLEVGRAMQMMELPPGTPHHSMGGGLNAPQVSQTQSSVQNWQSAGGDDQLLTGQVKGIHGVTMQLPQAGSTATTLLSSKDIHLERQTQFVLTSRQSLKLPATSLPKHHLRPLPVRRRHPSR